MIRVDLPSHHSPHGTVPSQRESQRNADAWRREMEYAQLMQWFAHGPLAPAQLKDNQPGAVALPSVMQPTSAHGDGSVSDSRPVDTAGHRMPGDAPKSARGPRSDVQEAHGAPLRADRTATLAATRTNDAGAAVPQPAVPAVESPQHRLFARSGAAPIDARPASAPSASVEPTPSERIIAVPKVVATLHAALQAQLAPRVVLAPLAAVSHSGPQSADAASFAAKSHQGDPVAAFVKNVLPLTGQHHMVAAAPPPATNFIAATCASLGLREPEERFTAPTRNFGPAPEKFDADPVRATALWLADGVRLWIGADAAAVADVAPALRQVEIWLRSQGVRLLGVTCNGRRWQEPSHFHQSQEQP